MKKELKKTRDDLKKLKHILVKKNLESTGKKVEKLGEEIFQILSKTIYPNKKPGLTFGQKTADALTTWAGSWFFIISFLIFIALWIFLNTYILINYLNGEAFDPFPFILLNLALSLLAALQAPVILMSQNRTSQRDRIRAEYDYKVNRKAEKEIREMKFQLNRIEERIK